MDIRPPHWAETVMRALVPEEYVESVTGDLLEQYRDEKAPSLGRQRADAWYVAQIGSSFLRAYWPFALSLTGLLILHDLSNTFRDPEGTAYLEMNNYPGIGITLFFLAGLYGGWRTGAIRGGALAGFGAYVIAWTSMAVWLNATFYPFAQFAQYNPYWIRAFHYSGAPGETFAHWSFWDNWGALLLGGGALLLLSLVMGSLGGAIGTLLRRCLRRRSA